MSTGVIAGGALIVILMIWTFWMYRKGGAVERGRAAEKGLSDARKAKEIDSNVTRLSDDELNSRLRGDK